MRAPLAGALVLSAFLGACGAAPGNTAGDTAGDAPAAQVRSAAGGEMPTAIEEGMDAATESVAPAIRQVVGGTQMEPQILEPMAFEPEPAVPVTVRLATLTLRGGGTFRPPTGACQDVLMFVRSGELRAAGTGIAPPSAPATLYDGDAIRFGPEGDGIVQNLSETPARTVVAYVRPEGVGEPSPSDPGPDAGDGCGPREPADPLQQAIRATSVRTTAPLLALGGKLRVRILLDADGAGARYGGLAVLDGDPDAAVPQHAHASSAEILFIEEGSGQMQVGDRNVRVRPGAAIYVPPGVLHDFRPDGTAPLRAIQVYSPSGPEQRFRAR